MLEAANIQPQEGSGHPELEFWVRPNGMPVTIPYAGRPLGQFYDKEALEAILAGN
jgi:hypothetical protein